MFVNHLNILSKKNCAKNELHALQISGSTNDEGNNPILPDRACVPLYQPFSRFLWTKTISPTNNSSSNSLFGGYDTMHLNLKYIFEEKSEEIFQFTVHEAIRRVIEGLTFHCGCETFVWFEH